MTNAPKSSPRAHVVTGGAGFIGHHLTRLLLQQGHRVLLIDNLDDYYPPEVKEQRLEGLTNYHGAAERLTILRADLTDLSSYQAVLTAWAPEIIASEGTIFHLAGRAGVRPSIQHPDIYLKHNVEATFTLAQLCRDLNLKQFIFASSSSVYGELGKHKQGLGGPVYPFKEEEATVSPPISPYAASKLMTEHLLSPYAMLYGFHLACVRFFTVFGPEQRPDLAIHKFTKLISENKPIPLYGDGTTKRDYTYILDLIEGLVQLSDYLLSRKHAGEDNTYLPINLGGGNPIGLMEMVEAIETAVGQKAEIDWQPPQPGDVQLTAASIEKANRLFGYQPKVPFHEGIRRFVEWHHGDRASWDL